MGKIEWIKLAVDMFDVSRKIKAIETMKNGDTIITIWFKLLCLAGSINDGGAIYITENVPYSENILVETLRRPAPIVKKALETFEEFGMIHRDNGIIYLTSWSKYQNVDGLEKIREQARERKQKQREKERENSSDVTQCHDECHGECHTDVTQCHAPKNEEERNKNKEDSFNHSIVREENELFEQEAANISDDSIEYRRKSLKGIGKNVVMLSDEQIASLFEKISLDEFNKYVGIVADCELKGKKFKSKTHYQAILDMVRKDRRTEAS